MSSLYVAPKEVARYAQPEMTAATKVFYLGTHQPGWLAHAGIPLFVSRRRLVERRSLPRAIAPWALDSGGFTELDMHGRWTVDARTYAREARRYLDEIGSLRFAAPQDWMCEPWIIRKTGLSVREHQIRTIDNFLELRSFAPDIPWIPVVQGWGVTDYWRHVEDYEAAGVDLAAEPLVGVGTVCRRQALTTAHGIMASLSTAYRLKLHGFGFKKQGLRQCSGFLASADSMAWSLVARREPALPGHSHKNCANCLEFALGWRSELPDEWLDATPR